MQEIIGRTRKKSGSTPPQSIITYTIREKDKQQQDNTGPDSRDKEHTDTPPPPHSRRTYGVETLKHENTLRSHGQYSRLEVSGLPFAALLLLLAFRLNRDGGA